MKSIKHFVFGPPFLLVFAAAVLSFTNKDAFTGMANGANNWLIANFGWIFSLAGLLMVVVCIGVYFSKLGKVENWGREC